MFAHNPWIEHTLGATNTCERCGQSFPVGGQTVYARDGRLMLGELPAGSVIELCQEPAA